MEVYTLAGSIFDQVVKTTKDCNLILLPAFLIPTET